MAWEWAMNGTLAVREEGAWLRRQRAVCLQLELLTDRPIDEDR